MNVVIRENVLLSDYTTLKVGGFARYFVEVEDLENVKEAVDLIERTGLPYLIVGSGSNLLISDSGFAGVVIHNSLKGISFTERENDEVLLEVASGEILDEVIAESVNKNYFGLENLSAIPGTVGATPVQNVGAYGVEVSDLIDSVETFHVPSKTSITFSSEDCRFGYRDSFFKTEKGKEYLITSVRFKLNKNYSPKIHYADLNKRFAGQEPSLLEIREAVIDIRSQKFPDWQVIGTAGSFFKNPIISKTNAQELLSRFPNLPFYELENERVKIPLGFILDSICNLKGYRDGKVGLFERQALVLVNYGGATTDEIISFVDQIEQKVYDATGIEIEPEVRFVGLKERK